VKKQESDTKSNQLKGKKMKKLKKLSIELVPSSSWGNNLRSEANLSKKDWDKLRKACYESAGHKCEICGGVGWRRYSGKPKSIVECHEIWSYDDRKKVQTLKGLIALCPTCHKAKHLGRTLSVEKPPVRDKVLIHILEQNEMTVDELEAYIVEVFEEHSERSRHQWKIDLSWLES